jgi:putative membrane protein
MWTPVDVDAAHLHGYDAGMVPFEVFAAVVLVLALAAYLGGVLSARRRGRWPWYRTVSWATGAAAAGAAVVGPLARAGHGDFTAHMAGHLLLGMLAPLLLVLAAPFTLALRALHPAPARRLARLLRSRPVRFLAHPITAAVLNSGGLWLLYAGGLYAGMHAHPVLFLLVHVHVLAAGYLFTAAIIGVDPNPHRSGFRLRAAVLLLALAAHNVLAKYLYAHPPAGVPAEQAEAGSMLMYYGGSVVDAALIFVFCLQWYRASARSARTARWMPRSVS